ncbi:MAG: hypothetical protein J5627_00360 [Bacilli bacterium]|nr:hypothetical protein [Bacilli bacterium]
MEANVIWSDESGRIAISVFGPPGDTSYGFASVKIGDGTVPYEACFYGYPSGISFSNPEMIENHLFDHAYFGFEFEKALNNDQMVMTTNFNFSGGEAYSKTYEIVLAKRAVTSDEMDWKYCVREFWISEDKSLFLSQNIMSPFTGEVDAVCNGEEALFSFLDDGNFKLEQGGSLLACGQYVSLLDGLDLVFDDDCGKEKFGERTHLLWAYDGDRPKLSQAQEEKNRPVRFFIWWPQDNC